jgi:hypothetical protein
MLSPLFQAQLLRLIDVRFAVNGLGAGFGPYTIGKKNGEPRWRRKRSKASWTDIEAEKKAGSLEKLPAGEGSAAEAARAIQIFQSLPGT